MFKKVAIFAVAGALAASLAGCAQVEGGSEESAQEPQQEQKADEGSRDSDAEQASNAVEAPSSPQPYLKESGWSYSGGYVNFCAIVGNTDPVNCYVLMPLDVTAKASDGTILANETFYAQWIAPNDTVFFPIFPKSRQKSPSISLSKKGASQETITRLRTCQSRT